MALGQNNISIATVQQAIGVYSTSSLGALIAKAKTGGAGNIVIGHYLDENLNIVYIYSAMAFYIYETRASNGNRYDGVLIPGAEPHWNRWSNKMPAEWVIESGAMILRLKRNALNTNGGYDFRLHDFRGYDHSALTPEFTCNSTFSATGGAVTIEWYLHMHQIKLPDLITHILVEATIGSATESNLIPLADIIDGELVSAYSVDFTGIFATSGSITAYASSSTGTKLATIANIVPTLNFAISHVVQYGYLSRVVGAPLDMNVFISGEITVPTGSGNIELPSGGTSISGITIAVVASSMSYTSVWFNLYLEQTGETDKYVGAYYVQANSMGITTNINNISVVLNSSISPGDNLAFKITSLTYS